MNGIMQNLLTLQRLDFGEQPQNPSEAAALRGAIPQAMLQQYDRRRARGKKGVAAVRNRVCTGCRMQVPIAVVATLMRGSGIEVCGNCGLYLFLPDPAQIEVVKPVVVAKAVPKSRKRKSTD